MTIITMREIAQVEEGVAAFDNMKPDINAIAMRAKELVITDDTAQAEAGRLLKEARQYLKALDRLKTIARRPIVEAAKKIDSHYQPLATPLKAIVDTLRMSMGRYATEQERKRRELERQQQDTVIKVAEKAEARGDTQTAERALQRGSELTVPKHAIKTEAATISRRDYLEKIEIHDFERVPDAFKKLDETAVRKHWQNDHALKIDGLKLVVSQRVNVR